MSRAESRHAVRATLASLLLTTGCGSISVFGTPHVGSPSLQTIRVAEERGIKEISNEPIRIEIPIEVRAGDEPISVGNGCVLRPFIMGAIDGSDFSLTTIRSEDAVFERGGRVLIPPDDDVVPARERRRFTIQLMFDSSDPDTEALGLRIDESPEAVRASDCVRGALADTSASVQHFGLQRIPIDPVGPGAAAVAVIVLFAII